MNIFQKILLFITLLIGNFSAYSQYNSGVKLENVTFQYNGENVIIHFDIANFSPTAQFYITPEIYKKSGQQIAATAFTGDIDDVYGGEGKEIIWKVHNDNITLNEEIYIKLKAIVVQKPNMAYNMALSAAMPGLGNYSFSAHKPHFLWGVFSYGCIASSILLNQRAGTNRENYLQATTPTEADQFYKRMKTQNVFSKGFAVAGIGIWTFNLSSIYLKQKQLENQSPSQIRSQNNYPLIVASSASKLLNTTQPIFPAVLSIQENSIEFIDSNNNNAIDANESGIIRLQLYNTGEGMAYNVIINVEDKNNVSGLSFKTVIPIGNIEKQTRKIIEIPVSGSESLQTAIANFFVTVTETNGFDAQPIEISIPTFELLTPNVIIADYLFSTALGGVTQVGMPINLKMIVQNIGGGKAENVHLNLHIPENVFITDVSSFDIGTLAAGEAKEIDFEFFANRRYQQTNIPVKADLDEKKGIYSTDTTMIVELNASLAQTSVVRLTPINEIQNINIVRLVSETDRNIPVNNQQFANRFALIIGNEDYTKYQTNLRSESNVDFARNDAQIFAEYAEKTLGVPKENITLVTDAIGSVMKREMERFVNRAKYSNGEVELIFYYSGHGYPDQNKESYIMPVDISGENVAEAIKLSSLYSQLTQYNTKSVTVFLDACFSGGGREQGLVAAKTVRIKPVENTINQGNLVVFSASSGDQESLFYDQKQHGIFTYCLLKKIQETNGNFTYGELADYLLIEVPKISNNIHYKLQNPEVNTSSGIENLWETWRFMP